jgi:asparagine synthase (glutamine-hydrolysing)
MCGIAGYYFSSGRINDTECIIKMLDLQRHRGPDDQGIRAFSLLSKTTHEYLTSRVEAVPGLEGITGFNRLSILDLSKNGHQPMISDDQKVILTFNGEIYNAFDFKRELEASGYTFKSATDTEVILYLFLKHGFDGMIRRLNGMFAIVLIDLRESKIYIARDRFGIKPMYLYQAEGLFAFSSEIKSFIPLPGFEARLNVDLLDEYLLFRNTINRTLFKGVECLDPGTYVSYSPDVGFTTTRYFDIDNYRRNDNHANFDDSLTTLRSSLKSSVKRQLMSDVTLGCQLSGGVDSSLVTYFAKDIKRDDLLETISITFDDPRFNEESYVDHVTQELGLQAHKFQLDAAYYLSSFDKATWHFEAPINHPNTIGIYLLSERAKSHVTVLLSGEGADEVFGGYHRFSSTTRPYGLRTLLSNLKKNQRAPFRFLLSYLSEDYRGIMASAYMVPGIAQSLKSDFNVHRALQQRRELFGGLSGSRFDKQIKYEIKSYLPDLLIRQDKMSMAHSIENRVPFLDNQLVEDSFKIPQQYLLSKPQNHTKYILKRMLGNFLGDSFSFREKGGFGIPLRGFFGDKEFRTYLNDELVPSISKRGIFNGRLVENWMTNFQHISSADLDALWIMIAFEAWAKKFNVQCN